MGAEWCNGNYAVHVKLITSMDLLRPGGRIGLCTSNITGNNQQDRTKMA
jgi:hypothetical protein